MVAADMATAPRERSSSSLLEKRLNDELYALVAPKRIEGLLFAEA
jgi:hypothetical protein